MDDRGTGLVGGQGEVARRRQHVAESVLSRQTEQQAVEGPARGGNGRVQGSRRTEQEEKVTSGEAGEVCRASSSQCESHTRDCGLFSNSNGRTWEVLNRKQCDRVCVFIIILSAMRDGWETSLESCLGERQ